MTNAYYNRYGSGSIPQHVVDWLTIISRFPEIEMPEQFVRFLQQLLFSPNVRHSANTVERLLDIGRPRIDPILCGRTTREIANLCLDNHDHLKLDARNLLPTVKNMGRVVQMFPEYANLDGTLRNSLRLGYYACAPDNEANKAEAIHMAVANIRAGEHIPTNPNAMLSANAAATILAINKFPEILEQVTPQDISVYVFQQARMIEHTWLRDSLKLLDNTLMDILTDGFMSFDDENKKNYTEDATIVFTEAARIYGYPPKGAQILNELFWWALRPYRYENDSMDRLATGWPWREFLVNIPKQDWDRYIKKCGLKVFIQQYIVHAMHHTEFLENPDYLNFIVDFLVDPEQKSEEKGAVLSDKAFRKKPILTAVSKELRSRVEDGLELTPEIARMLNSNRLLTIDVVKNADVRHFNTKSEEELDARALGQIDEMIDPKRLNYYQKSSNFPYFVNALLRAILELYDTEYGKARSAESDSDAKFLRRHSSYDMFRRFFAVANALLASPKSPTCIAAAKLARHSGLIDAYRLVADRYGAENPITNMQYIGTYRGGSPDNPDSWYYMDTDMSDRFKELIDKLDALGATRQKYKAGDMELQLKERK